MNKKNFMTGYIQRARTGQTYEERLTDPYKMTGKPKEPAACPECHAVFRDGRWTWNEAPERANEVLCPACMRMRDKFPAGTLTLKGGFFAARENEIMSLIKNTEADAKAERPVERIMSIDKKGGETVITFTDAHLAHGVGVALNNAYRGDLDARYTDEDGLLRITWSREF